MSSRHRTALTLLLLGFVLPMPSAQAHASLISSNPIIGAHLSKLPAHVEVEFDGNLITLGGAKTNVLQVQDDQGREIDAGNSKVAGPILGVDIKDQSEQGTFTVSWRVVSGDGHPVEGSYQFSIGSASPSLKPTLTPAPQHGESLWQRHQQEFYLGIAALLSLGIWAGFERKRRTLGKN
jgi:methionine-rich copper-binding protein CopC